MWNLTKEEVEKLHKEFPDARFTVSFQNSASAGYGGVNYTYEEVKELLEKYPVMEWETRDIKGFGPFTVIKQFPCVSVGTMKLSN